MRLRGVGKRYGGGPWAVAGVDLDLAEGEVHAVVGGNGAGKSTLLRLLVGLCRPTVGEVRGRPAVVGYVPDRFPPHERMSARAYLTHLGRVRGLGTRAATARAEELLARLALVGGAGTPIRRLSKGNAQKVALAQALVAPPGLLVLDEPWSGLDAAAHGTLGEIIAATAAAGARVVFTDHRESVTATHASAVHRIESGRLTPVATAAAPARLELRPVGDAVALAGLPGVLAVTEGEGAAAVVVDGDRCDAVLRAALAGGWSVRSVRR